MAFVDNKDLVNRLKEIGNLFDVGCEIIVGEDSIGIDGVDYMPHYVEGEDHITISRAYDVPFEYDDETGELKDTLTPVLERISKDRTKTYQMSPTV